jgi:hypothetical protein
MITPTFGFRVLGHRAGKRRPVDWQAAFAGYAACDPRAELDREAFLSHFTFGQDFVDYLMREGSERGYNGPCGASWLFWDIDRPDNLALALRDARRLAGAILERYRELDDDALLIFLSGGKGVHVGIPTTWHPELSPDFHAVARLFCLNLAEEASITVDGLIYSKSRLFRAPNSRHPKTGLFKRRLTLDELTFLKPEAVIDMARHPEPFEIPAGPTFFANAADDWVKAQRTVARQAVRRPAPRDGEGRLSAFLRRFIRDGELEPDRRAVSTFRAAAELAEFRAAVGFDALAHALLSEAALDSGLTPSEARRQIDCGLAHGRRQQEGGEHV